MEACESIKLTAKLKWSVAHNALTQYQRHHTKVKWHSIKQKLEKMTRSYLNKIKIIFHKIITISYWWELASTIWKIYIVTKIIEDMERNNRI